MSAAGKASGQRSLKLLCAGAVKGLVAALESRFLAARGAAIEGRFGAVGAMREALLGGAACDVLVVTAAMLAELRDQGVVAESPFAAIGEGALGCTQVTEILYTPGLTLAGPLPEPFGLATAYAAGV